MKRIAHGLLAGLAIAAMACASTVEERVLPADEQYAAAVAAFEAGEYVAAITQLQSFAFNYPQDPRIVDARWLTAEAYYRSEDWATAAQEHLNFQRDHPSEPRADDALYQAGRAYQQMSLRPELDQIDTRRAINVFERLLAEYPASELAEEGRGRRSDLRDKLAEKVYLNAEFYFDDEDYAAAEIYLVDLIENHADSSWLSAGYALLAQTLCQQGSDERAAQVLNQLRDAFPDSPAARETTDRLPQGCRGTPERMPAAQADGDGDGR